MRTDAGTELGLEFRSSELRLLKGLPPKAGQGVLAKVSKMTGTRLKAIEMLLDKTLPNLASVKHEVDAKQVVFLIDTSFDDYTNNSVPTTG